MIQMMASLLVAPDSYNHLGLPHVWHGACVMCPAISRLWSRGYGSIAYSTSIILNKLIQLNTLTRLNILTRLNRLIGQIKLDRIKKPDRQMIRNRLYGLNTLI